MPNTAAATRPPIASTITPRTVRNRQRPGQPRPSANTASRHSAIPMAMSASAAPAGSTSARISSISFARPGSGPGRAGLRFAPRLLRLHVRSTGCRAGLHAMRRIACAVEVERVACVHDGDGLTMKDARIIGCSTGPRHALRDRFSRIRSLPLRVRGRRAARARCRPAGTTVSGLSSGGYMAVQLHVAHSASVRGAGVLAGGPYYCAQGSVWTAAWNCMSPGAWNAAAAERGAEGRRRGARRRAVDPRPVAAASRVAVRRPPSPWRRPSWMRSGAVLPRDCPPRR